MTIRTPTMLRYIMISNVSSDDASSRPATAIAENEKMLPVIQKAAFSVGLIYGLLVLDRVILDL